MRPIWVTVSESHLGILEVPGPHSAAVILYWAKVLGIDRIYTNDDIAWCAVYINMLLRCCQLPTVDASRDRYDLMRALKFEGYGQSLDTHRRRQRLPVGTIGVFTRDGGGHVGLLIGHSVDAYLVRGGNQANAVSDAWIGKDRLCAARWPVGVPVTSMELPLVSRNGGAVSTNEA